jgi:hypothetical protein
LTSYISDFTLSGYVARLQRLIDLGYQFRQNFETEPDAATIFIRHDVDLDLSLALRMAEAEEKLGVKSTFFVLLNSELYNCFSKANRLKISKIVDKGHAIGVHFDAGSYDGNLEEHLSNESEFLSKLTGTTCKYYSQHKPGLYGFKQINSSSLVDANFLVRSDKIAYVSDSTGRWRFGDYTNLLSQKKSFELLVHPIWWMNVDVSHPRETLDAFLQKKCESTKHYLSDCITPYALEDGTQNGWPVSLTREFLD